MTHARCIVAHVSCIYTFHTIITSFAFHNTHTRLDSQVHYSNSVFRISFHPLNQIYSRIRKGYIMRPLQPFGSIQSLSALQP